MIRVVGDPIERELTPNDKAVFRAALRKSLTAIEANVTHKGGRAKVHASKAAKQKAYRERRKAAKPLR